MRLAAILLARLLLGVQTLVVVAISAAVLSSLVPARILSNSADTDPLVDLFLGYQLRLVAIFIPTAVVVMGLRVTRERSLQRFEISRASHLSLTAGLAVLCIWILISTNSWRFLWTEGVGLLEQPGLAAELDGIGWYRWIPTAVVLLVPGLLGSTALSLFLASVITLLLLWSRSGATARALIRWVVVAGASLFASSHTVQLFVRLAEPLRAELADAPQAAISEIEALIEPIGRSVAAATDTLTWQLAAYAALVPVVLLSVRTRILDPPSRDPG